MPQITDCRNKNPEDFWYDKFVAYKLNVCEKNEPKF
jgi:hypothetical protein